MALIEIRHSLNDRCELEIISLLAWVGRKCDYFNGQELRFLHHKKYKCKDTSECVFIKRPHVAELMRAREYLSISIKTLTLYLSIYLWPLCISTPMVENSCKWYQKMQNFSALVNRGVMPRKVGISGDYAQFECISPLETYGNMSFGLFLGGIP